MQALFEQVSLSYAFHRAETGNKESSQFHSAYWTVWDRQGINFWLLALSVNEQVYLLILFQTTLGRLMVEIELATHGRSTAIYACMSKSSSGEYLKEMVSKEFSDEHQAKLSLFNREEVCAHFGIEDSQDPVPLVLNIVDKLPSNSVIFFDEFPMKNTGKNPEDWSQLKNVRENDVSVIISFQPLDFEPTYTPKILSPKFPENANVVTLSLQFRSSKSIFDFNNELQTNVPVQHSGYDATPSDSILGPGVSIVHIEKNMDMNLVKTWIQYQLLWQLRCTEKQVKILSTDNTETVTKDLF